MTTSIEGLGDLRGKRVLVRSDLNVPLDGETITDDGRIRASVPTISALTEAGARVIVCAHLGRPKGAPDPKYSLAPVAARLGELLGQDVTFATDTVGESARAAVAGLADGGVVLLENLRFNAGETAKVEEERAEFADALAGMADAYVSDGFGVVHRKQASVYDIAKRLPSAMGGLVRSEVEVLQRLTENPERPYAVVLGGAKVSDKLGVIANLLTTADRLLIGGGMVFTFLAAQGHEVGKSLLEQTRSTPSRATSTRPPSAASRSSFPSTSSRRPSSRPTPTTRSSRPTRSPPTGWGSTSVRPPPTLFAEKLADCRTVFWNGPAGAFEMAPYAAGTKAVAQALVDATARGALTVVGGGDSAAAVRRLGFSDDQFGHISTGGGASLEYLEGKELPGIAVLQEG